MEKKPHDKETVPNPVGRPPMFKTPEELQTKVDEYFIIPDDDLEKRFTVCGLAYSLGFSSRQSIYDYLNKGDEFSYIVKRAVFFIESRYEGLLQSNNVAGVIFALKNMGWKDKTEQETTHRFNKMPTIMINGKEAEFDVG